MVFGFPAKSFHSCNEMRNQGLEGPNAAFAKASNEDSKVFPAKPQSLPTNNRLAFRQKHS
jgi:hypothetical protein